MDSMPERMTDHWWWLPGMRPGRRMLLWHILLDGQQEVSGLVRRYQDMLAGVGGLDLVPAEWLHMTTQIVGFEDEIPREQVEALVAGARRRLGALAPIEVEVGRLWVHGEGVALGIRPERGLDPVREAVRQAAAETAGVHPLDGEPGWTPHVSVAYSNADGPAAPIADALDRRPDPVPFRVGAAHLVAQVRDGHLYRWEHLAEVPLG
ncbi:2'-5' RNA ligase [Actinomadura coerulea]|uniref:2'-5' RNA ligase n=2 Tax=Actinomadura coerulea TaxID=46159 RepID=A0A7X0G4N7_9ACTN|nr:2'-5' RNA ligase [Actinomadura coerulea]